MKLADLEVIVTAPPAPGWGGRYWILLKLTTDTGITGWGECYAASVGPAAMEAVIRDVFERHMAGENPENIELMFRRAYSSGFTQRPRSDRDGRVFGTGDRLLGYPWQGPRPSGLGTDRRADERAHPRLYLSLPPRPPRATGVLGQRGYGGRGGGRSGRKGLYRGQIRPRRSLHNAGRAPARNERH